MIAVRALIGREFIRLWREPTRLIGLLGTTLLFWLVIGSGMGASFALPPGTQELQGEEAALSYAGYLLPGMIAMIVLFGTIVSAITLIQDRQAGFLQSVLVSPAPAWSIVVSKNVAAVGTTLLQTLPLVAAAPVLGVDLHVGGVLLAIIAIALCSMGVLNVGLLLAWRINSIAGFHGVMNLVLLPMWLLSGALFPLEGAAGWMRTVMNINPMHWYHRAIAGSMGTGAGADIWIWLLGVLFAGVTLWLATFQVSSRVMKGDGS